MLNEVVGVLCIIPIYMFCFVIALKRKLTVQKHVLLLLFCGYLGLVIAVTLFPFPIQKEVIMENKQYNFLYNNFIPFKGIIEVISTGDLNVMVRNIFGNILLTLPLGYLLPLMLNKIANIKSIFSIGLFFSIGIESIQFILSAILGYTYKITDVDDIILNVTGASIGYICFKLTELLFKR